MEEFIINYKDIYLKIQCEKNLKALIIKHLYNHVYFLENYNNPTYTVIIDNENISPYGLKETLVDKWFDNATFDCYIDNEKKICYANNFKTSSSKDKNSLIVYLIANLFYRFLEIDGYIGLHSSCAEFENKGILFVADRFSGKTNCMLNLVHNGFNYVTNKKIALKKIDNDIIGYGINEPISIRLSPSFCRQVQNEKYILLAKERGITIQNKDLLEGNSISISDQELIKMNNVKQSIDAPIKCIIKPVYDSSIKNLKIKEMNKEQFEDLILSQYLPLVHETKDFLKNIQLKDYYIDKKIEMLKEIFEIPNFICYQNENTTKEFVKEMKQIIRGE